jgi:hypothetical protein
MDDAERPNRTESEISNWIRRHPEVWHFAGDLPSQLDDEWFDQTVDDIVSGARERRRRARRRRHRAFTAGVAVAVLASGGTVAALLIREGQPTRPEAGVSCRAEAAPQTDAIEVGAAVDPIAACRAQWESGAFGSDVDVPSELVACIDPVGGAINVIPGDAIACADLSMETADPELDVESDAVVALQDRLVEEINLADCAPAADVAEKAQAILDESALTGWRVQMIADPTSSVCAKVGVDSPTFTVFVNEL